MVRPKRMCLYAFANALQKSVLRANQLQKAPAQASPEQAAACLHRFCLLEISTSSRFTRATHYISKILNYNTDTGKYLVQVYNGNGEVEGQPLEEFPTNIVIFPNPGSSVILGPKENEFEVICYGVAAGIVELCLPDALCLPSVGESTDNDKVKSSVQKRV